MTRRILFAVLLAAAPAFADRYGRGGDDRQGDWSGGYDDEQQYEWAPSDGSEGGWQSGDDPGYAEQRGPTLDDFRGDSELNWNGEWITTPEYGTVWRPTHLSDEWQPYLYGRWVWTSAGWAWASEEPFGWAVYHYGRWAWAPSAGWMWVAGRVWAPAWVAWRWTDGYAAWCPLGPRSVIVERPSLWVVVPSRNFLEPVRHHLVPRSQRPGIPLPQRPGPQAGPAIATVERVVGRTLRPLAIGSAAAPSSARAGSGSIDFYRPRTAPIAAPARPVLPSGERTARPASPGPRAGSPPGSRPSQPAPRPQVDSSPGQRPAQAEGPKAGAPHAAPAPRQEEPHAVTPRSTGEQPQARER
jgi:hypothetical protein